VKSFFSFSPQTSATEKFFFQLKNWCMCLPLAESSNHNRRLGKKPAVSHPLAQEPGVAKDAQRKAPPTGGQISPSFQPGFSSFFSAEKSFFLKNLKFFPGPLPACSFSFLHQYLLINSNFEGFKLNTLLNPPHGPTGEKCMVNGVGRKGEGELACCRMSCIQTQFFCVFFSH